MAIALPLAAFDMTPKDQGIGGTGAISRGDDNGITGTGYFGTITGFGSIWINGREIEFDDQTQVRIDGVVASISDLKKGQVIALRSASTGEIEVATTVEVMHSVIGRLDHYDAARGTGIILGQVVDFNSRVDREGLSVGSHYAVSGLRAENSVIVASLVEPVETDQILLRGNTNEIKSAYAAMGAPRQAVKSGNSLIMTGEWRQGKVGRVSVRAYSVLALLQKPRQVIVESYVGPQSSNEHRFAIDNVHRNFVLSDSVKGVAIADGARMIVTAQALTGRMAVTAIQPAAFDDHGSRRAKALSQSAVEHLVRQNAGTSDDQNDDNSSDTSNDDSNNAPSSSDSNDDGASGSDSPSESEGHSNGNSNDHSGTDGKDDD